MPLSNVNSVIGEANPGKTNRRPHIQDESAPVTAETPAETGHHTHTHKASDIHYKHTIDAAHTHLITLLFLMYMLETDPLPVLRFTLNRWFKGQPLAYPQEASSHLDAH